MAATHQPTVLVVEDEADLRQTIVESLEAADFAVAEPERELILRCLQKTGGNKRQAARLLSLSRTTLIDKLQRLGVDGPDDAAAAE